MAWQRALAFAALFGFVAPIYFFVFWRWFDFFRTRRSVFIAMLVAITVAVYGIGYVIRSVLWIGHLNMPIVVAAFGWILLAVATVFGTVADRQIGFRVRSFRPLFERRGHLDLKTTGAYGVVRHPIYSAGLGELLALFLVTGYPSVLVIGAVFAVAARWFSAQEEAHLVGLLDDPAIYERYRRRVPALIPRLRRRGAGDSSI